MNNKKPPLTVGEHIHVDNANTSFIIKINTSNLQKCFKVHYIIENTDEYNVAEERCRPLSINAELNSRRRLSTTTRISLDPLNSNTSNTSLPQPPIQPSPKNINFED